MSQAGPSVEGVIAEFVASQPPSEQTALQQELFRFARWFDPERKVEEVTAMTLEAYQDYLQATGADLNRSLGPLKALFTYTEAQGLVANKLAKFVKVKRGEKKSNQAPRQVEERQKARLTQDGHETLHRELEHLVKEVRPQIAQSLMDARADRDIRENAPFDAAKDYQAQVEARIRELEQVLSSAEIIQTSVSDTVILGSTVTIRDLARGDIMTYVLVTTNEANPRLGRISIDSPVGRALLDKREGQEVEVAAPAGSMRYRVERIGH